MLRQHWAGLGSLDSAESTRCLLRAEMAQGGSKELQLLHGITGCFRPGVMTALMGATGAGTHHAWLALHRASGLVGRPWEPAMASCIALQASRYSYV